jgi:ankyrin repeat protein
MASEEDSTNVAVTDAPLYAAIRAGNLSKVKEIIANDPDALYRGDGALGETPLHEAVAAGEIEIARFLIESGADVNAMDNRRGTPLTTAMESEASDEMIQLLEEYGAED